MPLISTKGIYGLTAIFELCKNNTDIPMQIKDISKNTSIPKNYLEQLLNKLRKARYITSIRGSKGGYLLNKDPKTILIKDIIITLEGDLKIIDDKCLSPVLNIFFLEMKEKTQKIFELSLDDLYQYQDKFNKYVNYTI